MIVLWLLLIMFTYFIVRYSPPIIEQVLVVSLLVIPISVFFLPLAVLGFYVKKISSVYPSLRRFTTLDGIFGTTGSAKCPLCHEAILQAKTASNPILLPHSFRILRHYERRHVDIANYARGVRLATTGFLHTFIIGFAALVALGSLGATAPAQASLVLILTYLVTPFLSILLSGWGILFYVSFRKRSF